MGEILLPTAEAGAVEEPAARGLFSPPPTCPDKGLGPTPSHRLGQPQAQPGWGTAIRNTHLLQCHGRARRGSVLRK